MSLEPLSKTRRLLTRIQGEETHLSITVKTQKPTCEKKLLNAQILEGVSSKRVETPRERFI
jgi:hypothetical protein